MTTNNGLSEFREEKSSLEKDAEMLLQIINEQTGHLGDVTAELKAIILSINLKADKLAKILEYHKCPHTETIHLDYTCIQCKNCRAISFHRDTDEMSQLRKRVWGPKMPYKQWENR